MGRVAIIKVQQLIKRDKLESDKFHDQFSVININFHQNALLTNFKIELAVLTENIFEEYMILRENEIET